MFKGCTKVKRLEIPGTVTSLAVDAFKGLKLEHVTFLQALLPTDVTTLQSTYPFVLQADTIKLDRKIQLTGAATYNLTTDVYYPHVLDFSNCKTEYATLNLFDKSIGITDIYTKWETNSPINYIPELNEGSFPEDVYKNATLWVLDDEKEAYRAKGWAFDNIKTGYCKLDFVFQNNGDKGAVELSSSISDRVEAIQKSTYIGMMSYLVGTKFKFKAIPENNYDAELIINGETVELDADSCYTIEGINETTEVVVNFNEKPKYTVKARIVQGEKFGTIRLTNGKPAVPNSNTYMLSEGYRDTKVSLAIICTKGYELGKVVMDGVDVTEQVVAEANGVLTYTIPSLQHNSNISVTLVPEPTVLKGDVNNDGKVDVYDAVLLLDYCLTNSDALSTLNKTVCDVDGNGVIDQNDAKAIINKYLGN